MENQLSYLSKYCDLENPEEVSNFIANMEASNSYKNNFVTSYYHYVKLNGLSWDKPNYKYERKIPKIPGTEALIEIMSATPKKYATIFKIVTECTRAFDRFQYEPLEIVNSIRYIQFRNIPVLEYKFLLKLDFL